MKLRFTILATLVLALSACGGEEAQKAATDVKAAAKPKKDPAAKAPAKAAAKNQEDEQASPLSVPEGYRYEQGGRRDPFVNPIPKPPAPPPLIPTIRPAGLAGVLVAEAKVSAIVTSSMPGMTKALLTTGNKSTFFVVRGDRLFDGIVKEIRANEVVFTMISPATKQPVGEKSVQTGSSAGTSAGEK